MQTVGIRIRPFELGFSEDEEEKESFCGDETLLDFLPEEIDGLLEANEEEEEEDMSEENFKLDFEDSDESPLEEKE